MIGMDEDAIEPCRHLHFPEATRTQLESKFISAWLNKRPEAWKEQAKEEAYIFIEALERGSEHAHLYLKKATAEQQRKERLEAFANAADRLLDTLLKLDDLALGHALFSGLLETAKLYEQKSESQTSTAFANFLEAALSEGSYSLCYKSTRKSMQALDPTGLLGLDRPITENLSKFHIQSLAYDLQNQHSDKLRAFTLGIRQSLKDLPKIDKDGSSLEFQIARFIEDHLGRLGLEFSISDTGLAGLSFIATMELSGQKAPRAGYWLKKAKEHPDSWSSFVEKMRK